jgi:site-specific DNA-methyltransferase (adenine-specific)
LEINKAYHIDCVEGLKLLADNSIDAIVTDPPYELGFMGKKWDSTGIAYNIDMWKECLRVLKPGGHLLSFGGARTYHRMTCAIEDAGFEIRDQIMWIYSQGMPKSQNIKKAIEKKSKSSELAEQWLGWESNLKPAHEPIVLARKPLSEKTIADNVLKWSTGGLNIDECRIPTDWKNEYSESWFKSGRGKTITWNGDEYRTDMTAGDRINSKGRYPANVIFDEEAAKMLDEQSGILKSDSNNVRSKIGTFLEHGGLGKPGDIQVAYGDSGGASRFFYCAKATKKERNQGCENLIVWENVELNPLIGELSRHLKDILEYMMQKQKNTEWNILSFGKEIVEKYPRDMIFITKMGIKLTTILEILNLLINSLTKESIRDVLEMVMENGINLAENVEKLNQLKQNTINEEMESLLGVVNAVLATLLKIKEKGRVGNIHSTVKPLKLMEYLIKLVTPPNGIILDPFAGSGTTLLTAKNLGFNYIGFEKEEEYMEIINKRLA